jgi:hypothetical protein
MQRGGVDDCAKHFMLCALELAACGHLLRFLHLLDDLARVEAIAHLLRNGENRLLGPIFTVCMALSAFAGGCLCECCVKYVAQ